MTMSDDQADARRPSDPPVGAPGGIPNPAFADDPTVTAPGGPGTIRAPHAYEPPQDTRWAQPRLPIAPTASTSETPRAPLQKPGTVRWGLGILWVGVVLTPIVLLFALGTLASVADEIAASPEASAAASLATGLLVVAAVTTVAQAVLLVFAGKGRSWARVGLAILSVIGIVGNLVSGVGINVGALLTILACVLLFVPASNAWFDEMHRRQHR